MSEERNRFDALRERIGSDGAFFRAARGRFAVGLSRGRSARDRRERSTTERRWIGRRSPFGRRWPDLVMAAARSMSNCF
jgi:hypothetical protein